MEHKWRHQQKLREKVQLYIYTIHKTTHIHLDRNFEYLQFKVLDAVGFEVN